MVHIKKIIDILHELVLVNNDRVKWYEQATKELEDTEPALANLFLEFTEDSRVYAQELDQKMMLLGTEDGIASSTWGGKISRAWNGVKLAFSGNTTLSILEFSEDMEDEIQRTYTQALEKLNGTDEETVRSIQLQQSYLKEMHDKVKSYRDRLRFKNKF